MEDTISNKHKLIKCKDCRWLKNLDYSRGEGIYTQPYRSYTCNVSRRYFSTTACKYFDEREDNMLSDETLKDFQAVLDSTNKTLDSMECMLDRELEVRGEEPPIPEELNIPINRYGVGQTLYLPVKVVGIRSRKIPNGDDIVLYELSTATDQRMGFKIFNHVNDIRHDDKDHYMISIPESYLRDYFKEG